MSDAAESILAAFSKGAKSGEQTRAFAELSSEARTAIEQRAELRAGELPVVGGFHGAEQWLLLTTERLLWHDAEGGHTVAVREITTLRPRAFGTNAKGKEAGPTLIVRVAEQEYQVPMETYRICMGLWNALMIARQGQAD